MTERTTREAGREMNRWLQLGACIIGMMAIANLQYAWTLFTVPLTASLQATLSAVQLAFTLFILAETWLVPVEGYLIDSLGPRRVVSVGGLLVGAGWIGSGFAESLAGLYFWYTVGGIGAGAVYGASIGTALKWFPDRRGLAAGLAAGAYGFGTALTILPIQQMIDTSGYRSAFIVWGILQGAVVIGVAQLMRQPRPGWKPSGWVPVTASAVVQSRVSKTPLQMVRTPTFWLMYLMMTMVAFGGLMVTAQLRPIAAQYGIDRAVIAWGYQRSGPRAHSRPHIERDHAAVLGMGVGPYRTLHHNGDRLRARSDSNPDAAPAHRSAAVVRCPFGLRLLRVGRDLFALPGGDR